MTATQALFAVLYEDPMHGGRESILAAEVDGAALPLVFAWTSNLDRKIEWAKMVGRLHARATGDRVRFVKFSARLDVEILD